MKRLFFLDDDPMRARAFLDALNGEVDVTVAQSVAEGLEKFRPPYDGIFLDHDLGDFVFMSSECEQTGAEFLRKVNLDAFRGTPVFLHSYNPVGAANMRRLLNDAGVELVFVCPFGPTILRVAREVGGLEAAA
jgi:CheY-like chemotaxis protein